MRTGTSNDDAEQRQHQLKKQSAGPVAGCNIIMSLNARRKTSRATAAVDSVWCQFLRGYGENSFDEVGSRSFMHCGILPFSRSSLAAVDIDGTAPEIASAGVFTGARRLGARSSSPSPWRCLSSEFCLSCEKRGARFPVKAFTVSASFWGSSVGTLDAM